MPNSLFPVHRVEIVIDSSRVSRLIELIEKAGQSEYTLIRDAAGRGISGERGGDQVSGVFSNSYVLIVCDDERLAAVLRAVKPQIKRFGGICLVSRAEMLKHWE